MTNTKITLNNSQGAPLPEDFKPANIPHTHSGSPKFRTLPKLYEFCKIIAEIQFKLLNEKVLSTGEPCTCECVTLLQSFHRDTLSIHWSIAQNF